MSVCQHCGRRTPVMPVPELRAVLCMQCDVEFAVWRDTHPWCVASDWPAWHRRTPMTVPADAKRDACANATNTRPLNATQRHLLGIWRLVHDAEVTP